MYLLLIYSKICVKRPVSKRSKIGSQDQLSLNAGQKYCRMLPCRMLQREHSAILSDLIKLPFVIRTFVLSIFEWPFYTGFSIMYILFPCFNSLALKTFVALILFKWQLAYLLRNLSFHLQSAGNELVPIGADI